MIAVEMSPQSHIDTGHPSGTGPTRPVTGAIVTRTERPRARVAQRVDLLIALTRFGLRKRYAGTRLGAWWNILSPLLLVSIFSLVFATFLKVEFHSGVGPFDFALYLVCGALPWFTLQDSLSRAVTLFSESRDLLRTDNFPAWMLPVQLVVVNQINGLFAFGLFMALVVTAGPGFMASQLLLPLIVLIQFMLTLGLTMFISALNVAWRDIEHIVRNGLMVWMFLTPIFYPSSAYPEELNFLLVINPIAHLADIYRETTLRGHVPFESLATVLALSIAWLAIGAAVFVSHEKRLPDLA